MIRLDAQRPVQFCDGFRRRDFLHAGALSFFGLTLPDFLRAKAAAPATLAGDKAKNCILLFLVGGPSQHDTFDPKPEAPVEIRGPFKAIKTKADGILLTEILPLTAQHADKFSIVRSVYHTAAAIHETGHQMMQTGRLFQGGIEYPHMGCVYAKLRGPKGDMPPHVMMPDAIGNTGVAVPHGESAGFLGKTYDPFVLNADPSKENFEVPDMLPPDYLAAARVSRRRSLHTMMDDVVRYYDSTSEDARLLDSSFQQAYTLMSSTAARKAFRLGDEPEALRHRYGINKFGQSCVLARRLVEAGVRFVTINMFDTVFNDITWDSHGSKPFSPISGYKELVGPMFDRAYSSLLDDLQSRGLLDDTLVVAMGEFGRTPKINPAGGRDHWPGCWSILFAGGGVKGGRIVGSSDEIGSQPKDRPTTPAEVVATVFSALGIPLDTLLPGLQGRPTRVVDHGVEPIKELF
ncbi:MAG TPA: DUF1501 domain-containing protein [Bryobacterales bacterium]|nr:DUF1501 domain-containing protein [Bryobacterales bacterium]